MVLLRRRSPRTVACNKGEMEGAITSCLLRFSFPLSSVDDKGITCCPLCFPFPLHLMPDQSDACIEYATSLSGLSWAQVGFLAGCSIPLALPRVNQNKHQACLARLLNGPSSIFSAGI